MISYRHHERGVTSIIIVMFSVLLLVTMTVGFMQLMMNEQVRSDDSELSQGAYDSALAGVEDGKRVLAACQNGVAVACDAIKDPVSCNTTIKAGLATGNGEVYLKTSSLPSGSGKDYEQAYTCLKIHRQTRNYLGSVEAEASLIVPLRGVSAFEKVVVYWSIPKAPETAVKSGGGGVLLPALASWNTGLSGPSPALMRAQFIQYSGSTIAPGSFDSDGGRTTYLYPKRLAASTQTVSLATSDVRRSGESKPVEVHCSAPLALYSGYHCRAELADLPGDPASRVAYLRLTSHYVGSDVMVELVDGAGQIVSFNDVQPSIDSTGRAADVFRRVDARVELADPNEKMLYPRATVDVTNNFCKTFSVSRTGADYGDGLTICNPDRP